MIIVKAHKRKGRIVKSHARTTQNKKGKWVSGREKVPFDNPYMQDMAREGHLTTKDKDLKKEFGPKKSSSSSKMNKAIFRKGMNSGTAAGYPKHSARSWYGKNGGLESGQVGKIHSQYPKKNRIGHLDSSVMRHNKKVLRGK